MLMGCPYHTAVQLKAYLTRPFNEGANDKAGLFPDYEDKEFKANNVVVVIELEAMMRDELITMKEGAQHKICDHPSRIHAPCDEQLGALGSIVLILGSWISGFRISPRPPHPAENQIR